MGWGRGGEGGGTDKGGQGRVRRLDDRLSVIITGKKREWGWGWGVGVGRGEANNQ